jgi:hypothetical protein
MSVPGQNLKSSGWAIVVRSIPFSGLRRAVPLLRLRAKTGHRQCEKTMPFRLNRRVPMAEELSNVRAWTLAANVRATAYETLDVTASSRQAAHLP